MNAFRKWSRFAALLLCLASAALPCLAEEAAVPELLDPVGVKLDTATAYIGEISTIALYDGAIVPHVEALWFENEGSVEAVHVVIGQQVREGDLLVTLNHEAQDDRIEALTGELEALEINAEYDRQLAMIDLQILETELRMLTDRIPVDDQAVALKKLDIEQFQLEMNYDKQLLDMEIDRLKKELEELDVTISRNELRAPMDGRIMFGLQLEKGSHVTAYTPVLYLADDSVLSIECDYISGSHLERAHAVYALIGDSRFSITSTPLDDSEYISRVLSGETVMSQFSIDNPTDALSAGQYAAVYVENNYVADALLVPSNALYSDITGRYVYVIEDGVRSRRSVKTGASNDSETQILEGLEEGEVVYVKS